MSYFPASQGFKRKPLDGIVIGNTLTSDDDLVLNLKPGIYLLSAMLKFNLTFGGGVRFKFEGTNCTPPSFLRYSAFPEQTSTTTIGSTEKGIMWFNTLISQDGTVLVQSGVDTTPVSYDFLISGDPLIVTSTNASIRVQYSEAVPAYGFGATLYRHSFINARRIG